MDISKAINTAGLKTNKLYLFRFENDTGTEGKLYIGTDYYCDTLEDIYRDLSKEKKVYGETAIPYGTYKIQMTYSPSRKKDVPLLLDVPHFTGILIHSGSAVGDSEGCILLGYKVGLNKIAGGISKNIVENLIKAIKEKKIDEITILKA